MRAFERLEQLSELQQELALALVKAIQEMKAQILDDVSFAYDNLSSQGKNAAINAFFGIYSRRSELHDARDLHEINCQFYRDEGWHFDKRFDAQQKLSPTLTTFDSLNAQLKQYLCGVFALIKVFIPLITSKGRIT